MPSPREQRQRNNNRGQTSQGASETRNVVIGFGRDFTAALERSQRNVPLPASPTVISK